MKTATLTFHASHNYGSMLQAYALQQILYNLGVENEIINLRTDIQKGLIPPQLQWCHPCSSLVKLLRHPIRSIALQRKYHRFEKFLVEQLHLTPELSSKKEVEIYLSKHEYDALIVGSDQIWNPACWDFDTSYLLDFTFSFKRIAYAPSLGSYPQKISKEQVSLLNKFWLQFDCLSTREQEGSEFVAQCTGREVMTVLDPTLLLDKESYNKLCNKKRIIKDQYIFYYTPREEKGTFRAAQRLSKKTGLKIVVTQDYPEYVGSNVIHVNDCGPSEYINIVKNSDYTIGKSFHLLAFSIIFEKEFLMVSRSEDSRFDNILSPLNLKNRCISPEMEDFDLPDKINYDFVRSSLLQMQKDSIQYLKEALFAYESKCL